MPTSTFFTDRNTGKIIIKDYDANDTVETLRAKALSPDASVIFHSEYDFITIRGTLSVSSIVLPAFSRTVHTWSDGGKCFITTAAVEIMGLGDKDDVLETLRRYRDEYMCNHHEGRNLVLEYYEIAPRIVKAIDESDNPIEIYTELYYKYILKAKEQIDVNLNEEAMETYRAMVEFAKNYMGE